MEKERGTKIIAVIALCVALLGLGIGFAAFSLTLTFSGTAEVRASSWEVVFQNLGEAVTSGSALELSAPIITDTTISDYSVSLVGPGDSISYTFDIANNGTFDAEIAESFILPTPTCTGSGDNAVNDANNVCANLDYTLIYVTGETNVLPNDELLTGQTKAMKLTLKLQDDMSGSELPEANVSITNLGFSIIYQQK